MHDTPRESSGVSTATLTKGSVVRGLAAVLARRRMLTPVLDLLAPAQRALLEDPPASSAWVAITDVHAISVAIERAHGAAEARKISEEGLREGLVPLMSSALSALLRLFGASPHTLFSRLNDLMKVTNRGVESSYTRLSDRSLRVTLGYPHMRDVPPAVFTAIIGSFDVILSLCGTTGTVSEPVIVANGRHNAATYEVRW